MDEFITCDTTNIIFYLIVGNSQELLHHLVNVVVLQVRIVSDGWIAAGLIPAEAFGRVVAVRKDPCWEGRGQRLKTQTKYGNKKKRQSCGGEEGNIINTSEQIC